MEADPRLKVIIVEDHHIFRQALTAALACDEEILVIDSCGTPEEALARLGQAPVDVVIVDLEWRGDPYAGAQLIRQVRELSPGTAAVVFSGNADEESVRQVLAARARGYLLKDEVASVSDVAEVVKAIGRGEVRYSKTVVEIMARLGG